MKKSDIKLWKELSNRICENCKQLQLVKYQQDFMALLNEMTLLRDMLQEYDPNQQRTAHYPDSMHRYAINAVIEAEKSVLFKQPKTGE